jgi:hypothetical protein
LALVRFKHEGYILSSWKTLTMIFKFLFLGCFKAYKIFPLREKFSLVSHVRFHVYRISFLKRGEMKGWRRRVEKNSALSVKKRWYRYSLWFWALLMVVELW